jgi:type IV secretory pathway TrbD component
VYQSLQRPKLLRGGEWQLAVANNLAAAGLTTLAFVTWNWRLLLGGAFFAWPVQWLIRNQARLDPQWWQIYFRSRRRPLIREPHGYAHTVAGRPLAIIPKPSKWLH